MLASKFHVRRDYSWSVSLIVLGMIGLSPLAEPATAQGTAPSSIIGQVTDASGAILPGVTVTATSPALQAPQVVTVTNEGGEYRLSPLAVGVYTVTYELSGFQTLRLEGIRLTLGFVAKLDQTLTIGAVTETITVTGASPLVDVASTATRTELTLEAVETLPTSRDGIKAFFLQVPGVRSNLGVGSSELLRATQFNAYGQLGASWQTLEGVFGGTPTGSHFEFNSLDGVRVQTVGSNAEMPRRGLLVDMLTKSGGNEFHFGAHWGYSNSRLQGNNIDDNLRARGVSKLPEIHYLNDLSANVGGRIIRNKLWFYLSGRQQARDLELLGAFYDDGRPILLVSRAPYHVEKLSYQMNQAHKIIFFNHYMEDFDIRDASVFRPAESRQRASFPYHYRKIEWQAVRGNSLMISAQQGYFGFPNAKRDGVSPGKPATIDIATQFVTGDHLDDGFRANYQRHHSKAVVSWYRPDLIAGSHEIKGGGDYVHSISATRNVPRAGGEYQLRFNNGAPFQLNTQNTPNQSVAHDSYLGLYAQDSWSIARRLTLNLGLRFDRNAGWVPEQCREAAPFAAAGCFPEVAMRIFNAIAPRVGASYDVLGNGKMAIKGSYGRFNHMRETAEVTALNRNILAITTWRWRDLNDNRNYDPGEVNLDPNGPDFVSISTGTPRIPNPNEKQPKTNEFSLSLERELVANWAVRVSGVYSTNFNTPRLAEVARPYEAYNIPITRPDPGPDGRLSTADDPGRSITYYEFPVALRGRAFETTMVIDDPKADYSFKTIEVAGAKRLSDGWQFGASYSATQRHIPFGRQATNPLAYNPNAETFTADETWEWIGKAFGSYALPYGFIASANFEHRSGTAGARQVLVSGGTTIPTIVLNVEPIGSQRNDSTNELDLGIEKRLTLGRARSLEMRLELFNALNINTITGWNLRSGPFFRNPTETTPSPVMPARLLQFSFTYAY